MEVLENYRKMGHLTGIADSIESLGIATYHQGDFSKARTLYFESLRLFHRYGGKSGIADCLVNIAILVGAQGFAEKFVQILGMAEALVPDIQGLVWPFIRTETVKSIETARAALGDEAYMAAYTTGHKMTLDEAVAYALKEME